MNENNEQIQFSQETTSCEQHQETTIEALRALIGAIGAKLQQIQTLLANAKTKYGEHENLGKNRCVDQEAHYDFACEMISIYFRHCSNALELFGNDGTRTKEVLKVIEDANREITELELLRNLGTEREEFRRLVNATLYAENTVQLDDTIRTKTGSVATKMNDLLGELTAHYDGYVKDIETPMLNIQNKLEKLEAREP